MERDGDCVVSTVRLVAEGQVIDKRRRNYLRLSEHLGVAKDGDRKFTLAQAGLVIIITEEGKDLEIEIDLSSMVKDALSALMSAA
jgi:hypothetical protein